MVDAEIVIVAAERLPAASIARIWYVWVVEAPRPESTNQLIGDVATRTPSR